MSVCELFQQLICFLVLEFQSLSESFIELVDTLPLSESNIFVCVYFFNYFYMLLLQCTKG